MKKKSFFLFIYFALIFIYSCKENSTVNPQQIDYKIFYSMVNYDDSRFDIYEINLDGTNNRIFKTNAEIYSKPQYGKIAFIACNDSTGGFTLIVSNIDGTNEKNIFNDVGGIRNPTISPLGNKLLFNERRTYVSFSSNFYLHICNIDGSADFIIDSTELFSGNSGFEAEFSPDGKSIAYINNSSEYMDNIYLIDINGKNKRKLNLSPLYLQKSYFNNFNWSPNGNEIIFVSYNKSSNETVLKLLNINNGETKDILKTNEYITKPVFSPDGKKIAYYKEPCNIWMIDIETKSEVQLTDLPGKKDDILFFLPQWSPDGKYILFEYENNDDANDSNYGDLILLEVKTQKVITLFEQQLIKFAFFGW
ncbi:MAG: PD40 domain-containing protein [Ignavibacteriae bacterium]|nr:PD40 domain-containing protein [Ignavibacteriota bacterium]